jgi:hypothetical protein
MGLLIGLGGYATYLFARPGGLRSFDQTDLWVGLALLFVTSTVGKFLGLRLAQQELRKAIREIRAQWPARRSTIAYQTGDGSADAERLVHFSNCCGRSGLEAAAEGPDHGVVMRR